jgi:hypothetical protein
VRLDIYDAFGSSAYKTNQEHLDTICALAHSIAEAQTHFPIVRFTLDPTTPLTILDRRRVLSRNQYLLRRLPILLGFGG